MRHKYIYLILSIALLLNAIFPTFMSFNSFAGSADVAALERLYGEKDKILICTSYGYKYVNIEDIKKEQEKPHNKDSHCPICVIASASAKLLIPEFNSIDFEYSNAELFEFPYFREINISEYNQSYNSSRAPPQIS